MLLFPSELLSSSAYGEFRNWLLVQHEVGLIYIHFEYMQLQGFI